MDVIQMLKQQHEEAKSAFSKLEQAPAAERGGLWTKLQPELKAHEQYEEQFVYEPIVTDAQGRDATLVSWHEHHQTEVREADGLIAEVGRHDSASETWLAAVRTLKSALERHIQEEEGDIWPRIQQVWPSQKREEVGRQVEGAKQAAGQSRR